ncbi:bifunctional 3,4-dihydroxy-2-butanone-4-phosphate synthase/GTP cyclohydrolase II [Ferrimonas balearica]|uniref:bifunctional 3,4-dihydroxy-2-butanone-4-phosphate synthase/GTP cyclohydrolase II n=1 Tax=Ferrimonas balearica TaxID=44012 RepID=UPI001EEEAB38|nr:bifunctional 3,4-dihydroxy-2-butanone-4-phosphate synthase/GTP cyclohydrolase II [Ferrimonas balearica]MBY6018040.1 3,4-dihydroxy-2-butanone-4-phosphate synthase [Halomonas denitrificans]MBY6094378.1 3,4-dihydroxy-2-butanone-4-phosphate synthase [Ferrimonas balearica]
MALNTINELIEDIRQGKMVILMDDEDRENEGDLIMAAEAVTPDAINFMARFGRGLICMPMSAERCDRLGLYQMVSNNTEQYGTAFTVSIEAAEGVTTGISAADRARTIQAAVAKDAKPTDLVQPGHIFPLRAKDGGVLNRAGHTEASVDLARLAGFESAAVIVEILNEDGTMARRPELEVFAAEHGIKIGTIADLIEYRNHNETTITREVSCTLPTRHGEFELVGYRDTIDGQFHVALCKGPIGDNTLVRVHLHDPMKDLLGSLGDSAWPLDTAMSRIAEEGGVLVILGREHGAETLEAQLQILSQEQQGQRVPRKAAGASRTVGVGSQILADLGVTRMRLLSGPKRYHALSGFGLEVTEYVQE